jgi:hypothetical protein
MLENLIILIGLGIFHGDLDFFDLHEKSFDLSNEIFPHKILKSLHSGQFRDQKSLDLREKSLDLSNYEIFPHKILKSCTF